MVRSTHQFLAVLAVVLLAVSSVAPALAASPSGMTGIPDQNIRDNIPEHAQDKLPSAAAFTDAQTSKHASSLDIEVTTQAAARGQAACRGGGQQPPHCDDPSLALNLTDDTFHDGRRVAVDAAAVEQAVGYQPQLAYGVHESGDEWTRTITYEDGMAVFEVPKFSTNTVTFEGEVSITATPATDGSSYEYELADVDSVSNYQIEVEGTPATETDIESGSNITATDSVAVNVAGDLDPSGPASGSPELALTANRWSDRQDEDSDTTGTTVHTYSGLPDTIDEVCIRARNDYAGSTTDFTVELSVNGQTQQVISETIDAETTVCGVADMDTGTDDTADVTVTQDTDGGNLVWTQIDAPLPTNVDVTASDGTTASFGNFTSDGETKAQALPVSAGVTSLDFSGDSRLLDWTFEYTERKQTENPVVEVNGHTTGGTSVGTLAAGESTNLSTDSSWVQSGTNRVNVTFDISQSADAPTPEVDLTYNHDATDDQEVTYQSQHWSERYNVSRTFETTQSDVSLTIPYVETMHSLRYVETRTNDGSWQEVPTSEYSWNGTTLTVDLGTVNAGDTAAVRTAGSKVHVTNGTIEVTDPTDTGLALDSEITVTEWNDDAYIATKNTTDRVVYTYNEAWDNPADSAIVKSDGTQHLELPNAVEGASARVSTVPLTVAPDTDVRVAVVDAGKPLVVDVSSGPTDGDRVEYVYYDTISGTTYELWSRTHSTDRDTDTASSPVTLLDDDSDEVLEIRALSDSSAGTGGTAGTGGVVGPLTDTNTSIGGGVLLFFAVLAFGAFVWLKRRFLGGGGTTGPIPVSPLVLIVGGIVVVGALEIVSGGQIAQGIADGLRSGLGQATMLLVLGGLFLTYQWLKSRSGPQEVNRIEISGGDGND